MSVLAVHRPRMKFSAVQKNWAKLIAVCTLIVTIFFIFSSKNHEQINSNAQISSLLDSEISSSISPELGLIDLRPPLSRVTLGHASWSILHTIAATFPDSPSENEILAARSLIENLSVIYPCLKCRAHFQEYLAANPVDSSSRSALIAWLCIFHNSVNRRLGKTELSCEVAGTFWPPKLRDTGCGCDEPENNSTGDESSEVKQ